MTTGLTLCWSTQKMKNNGTSHMIKCERPNGYRWLKIQTLSKWMHLMRWAIFNPLLKGLSKIIKVLTRSDAPTPKLSTIRQIMINDGTFLAPKSCKWFHKQRNQWCKSCLLSSFRPGPTHSLVWYWWNIDNFGQSLNIDTSLKHGI